MKLIDLSISLRENEFIYKAKVYEVNETAKAYKFEGKLIKKSLVKVIDSIYDNNRSFMTFSTWCLPEQVSEMEQELKEKCLLKLKERESDLKILNDAIKLMPKRKTIKEF